MYNSFWINENTRRFEIQLLVVGYRELFAEEADTAEVGLVEVVVRTLLGFAGIDLCFVVAGTLDMVLVAVVEPQVQMVKLDQGLLREQWACAGRPD